MKCEICGKELVRGLNFFGLFGQKACSAECMAGLAKRQQKETADALSRLAKKEQDGGL